MQRDLKIGLSLGILLVGVVGAFFFRRESEHPLMPRLQTGAALDAQISEKPRIPYLTGGEFDAEPAAPQPPAPQSPVRLTQTPPEFELPDFLKDDESLLPQQKLARQAPPPDPIRTDAPGTDAHGTGPIHTDIDPVVQRTESPGMTPNRLRSTAVTVTRELPPAPVMPGPAGEQTYVIHNGDTLTGLAQRFLGSAGRYAELYNFNQQVLPDPNRLPVGTMIRIPRKAANAAPQPDPVRSLTAQSEEFIAPPLNPIGERQTRANSAHAMANHAAPAPIASSGKASPKITLEAVTPIVPQADAPITTPAAPQITIIDVPATETTASPAAKVSPSRRFVAPQHGPFNNRRANESFTPFEANSHPAGAAPRTYRVRRGDTLAAIAQRAYGDVDRARALYDANRDRISDPNAIREGLVIILP